MAPMVQSELKVPDHRVSPAAGAVLSRGHPSTVVCRVALFFLLALVYCRASAATQQLALQTGWNLISIQVGSEAPGFTVAQVRAGLDRANVLDSVWAYDPVGRTYTSYQSLAGYPSDLTTVRPGIGYWVKVTADTVLTLSGPVWNGAVNLVPGWNLVGFPGLNRTANEAITLESVFRERAAKVPQVWTFQAGSSLVGGQRFVGYDKTARPPIGDLKTVEPGQGYWVYATEPLAIEPAPALVLAADTDIAPLAQTTLYIGTNLLYKDRMVRLAGPEDNATDLNGNGLLDDPYTQNTMLFDEGVNTQNITILNTNSSLLTWSISTATPWLSFSPTNGTTASESDIVVVSVNRSGLVSGTYTGTYTVDFGSTQTVVTVRLRVPTIAGDYRGFASIQRVNGKDIALGKVDLNLSMFSESTNPGETRFRAVINRDKALLFPKDVFLNGVFYQGNDFSLTTSFESPTGDRNVPPYTTFQNNPGDKYGDRDRSGDGKLDNLNPFPFPIYRQVTLLGHRVNPDRLEGTYIEAVENILPAGRVIYLEGTFQLDRETLEPTKKSIYNDKTTAAPVRIGGGGATGPYGYTNILHVPSSVQIEAALATVKVDFPTPSELVILLRGPQGQTATLFRNGTALAPVATFTPTEFNRTSGQGDWSLIVNWTQGSGERGFFNGWELNLQGLEFFSALGTIVSTNGDGTNVVAGATVLLAGSNLLPQSDTATNGTFNFSGLTENSYLLTVSKLGYEDATVAFRVTKGDTNLGNIFLRPIEISSPTLAAAPAIGSAPLNVSFTPLLPAASLTALGNNLTALWTFGDGETQAVAQGIAPLSHLYTAPGNYTATLTLTGSGGSLALTNASILALASGPNLAALPSAVHFVWGGGYVGSFASPLANANVIELTPTNIVFQESKRDTAAFDIDRFPFLDTGAAFQPNQEDTDADPVGLFQTYIPPTVNGVSTPDRYRMVITLGGAVFGEAPSRVGDFVLQAGRIED